MDRIDKGVSVVIKALNEEKYIEKAIQTALAGVRTVGGEVILADSCSTDKTIEIASKYPITIVQLANPLERCCGIGPQLGYQEIRFEFVFLMDGDMELVSGFLEEGLKAFALDSSLGGVAGMMEDLGEINAEFKLRQLMASNKKMSGPVSHLVCGGLYRASAIESVGYFSNRNLHSFEELELGVRLAHAGWKMIRLPSYSIKHHIHQMGSFAMLLSRWKNNRFVGPGEILRSAVGKPYFASIVPKFMFLYVTATWWLVLLASLFLPVGFLHKTLAFVTIFIAPFLLESFRRKGIGPGAYSITGWILGLIGALRGFSRTQIDPVAPIERVVFRLGQLFPAEADK